MTFAKSPRRASLGFEPSFLLRGQPQCVAVSSGSPAVPRVPRDIDSEEARCQKIVLLTIPTPSAQGNISPSKLLLCLLLM